MENNLNQDPKSKIYDFSHHWIIPVLHATLWGSALYVAQKAGHVLGSTDDEKIALFQFGTIFVVLFLEILIVMFDVYIEQRANYFAPKFLIFIVVLLATLITTAVYTILAIIGTKNINMTNVLFGIMIFSSVLKLLEVLLQNNSWWYVVKASDIIEANDSYTRRDLQ